MRVSGPAETGPAEPGPDGPAPRKLAGTDQVFVYADGGSRGNPGPAGYGAVVFAADGTTVLTERSEFLGRVTNNVAEYSGLIAGLRAAAELGARTVAVRMDSKLVVEQMSGRWQVKHPDMKPLARTAMGLTRRFDRVSFEWIPRARNADADRLANAAMDAGTVRPDGRARSDGTGRAAPGRGTGRPGDDAGLFAARTPGPAPVVAGRSDTSDGPAAIDPSTIDPAAADPAAADPAAADPAAADPAAADPAAADPAAADPAAADPAASEPDGRAEPVTPGGDPASTTLIVIRHGETTWGAEGRYAGREDVELTDRGRDQAAAVAERVAPLHPDVVLSSPLRRCRDTATAIAGGALEVRVRNELSDGTLGEWTGYTAGQISARWPTEFAAWRSDADAKPPGGESFTEIRTRVSRLLTDVLAEHPSRVVVLVTHAATTKMLLAQALDVPSEVAYRLQIENASFSVFTVDATGATTVLTVNETGHLPLPRRAPTTVS